MSFGMADVFIEKNNKPTDNEIIKALELCFAEKGTKQTCGKCPYHKFGELCKVKRDKDALDLINRLQAEIEGLHEAIYQGNITSEIKIKAERLHQWKQLEQSKRAKAEAIKEFAERLKEEATTVGVDEMYDGQPMYVSVECINRVKKEMVGGR